MKRKKYLSVHFSAIWIKVKYWENNRQKQNKNKKSENVNVETKCLLQIKLKKNLNFVHVAFQ